jgi:hypothetical protein
MKQENNQVPQTLGWYLENCPERLIKKTFSNSIYHDISDSSNYQILNLWQDIKTRDIWALIEECDFGEFGRLTTDKENLTKSIGMHDYPELILGVNAELTSPMFYGTAI